MAPDKNFSTAMEKLLLRFEDINSTLKTPRVFLDRHHKTDC